MAKELEANSASVRDATEICYTLHKWFNARKRFRFPFVPEEIPLNGIYILFEQGETSHGTERIVRIGTHTGQNQLPSRLQQHFVDKNKDRSIFRKNIGRAILSREHDSFLAQWELDLTSTKARATHANSVDLAKQRLVEARVSEYIEKAFTFAVFEVPSKADRRILESRLISTVSWCDTCRPSPSWLGLSSPKERIRESGLWLVNELYKTPLSRTELAHLRTIL